MNPKIAVTTISLLLLLFMFCASAVVAQTTAFSYQGRLTDGGAPANGTYDLQFTLYNASSTAIPSPLVREDVTVTNGIFTVQLDFGVSVFTNGQASTLEIGVRPGTATGAFTILSPRQPITATPYAIQTLNASQLGGVDASQYLQTNGNGSGLTNLNAGNITTGTLNNARLGLIPTANIADSAVTAPKIASGQVVKSLNTLKDNVTLAEGSNITITPAGNTLTIASTSGGVGGSGTTNTIPVWSGGTTLGNSGITQSPEGVQLPNGVQLGVGAQGNQVRFGSPNGETGMTIQGASGRADLRFDGTLKLVAGPAGFVASTNGIAITTQGLVGIGTTTPQSKLAVNAGGSGGEVRFSAPGGESGMSIVGTDRADVRFDGQTLKLLAGSGTGAMASTNGIAINRFGNVGIGTTAPALLSGGTGKLVSISDSLNPGIALTNTGARQFFLYSAGSPGSFRVFDATSGADRFTIDNVGNAKQEPGSNGLVKAMVYADSNGDMVRCYNSQLADGGASLPPSGGNGCGISVVKLTGGSPSPDGAYQVIFNFRVVDRFFSITPGNDRSAVSFRLSQNVNAVNVDTYLTDVDYVGSKRDSRFMLIVY